MKTCHWQDGGMKRSEKFRIQINSFKKKDKKESFQIYKIIDREEERKRNRTQTFQVKLFTKFLEISS